MPFFITQSGAWRDDAWKKLRVVDSQKDDNKIGEWERGEQTFRTPEFTLKTGRIWYLVKGAGRAYAPVNSYLLIGDPLHGAIIKEWSGEQWQWVEHNLSKYPGHRTHVEFSPAGGGDFAVAMVVQSDPAQSRAAAESAHRRMRAALGEDVDSMEKLARALQNELLRVVDDLQADRLAGSPDAAEGARLADWLAKNLDLFCAPGSPARLAFDRTLRPLAALRTEQTARIKPGSRTAPAMLDGNGVDELLLVRGQSKLPAGPVPRRFLEAVPEVKTPDYGPGSGRLQLARQLTDQANPFTARVEVNRVWYHLFGRGLVPTVDNFGVLGQAPSHPELLDHLADRFQRELGWSVKRLIREVILTQAYQMASQPADARTEEMDPQNLLLHRANVRRLEGEAIRDALLAVSGRLDLRMGGPSVPVHLTAFMEGRGRPNGNGPLDGNGRRSLYTMVRRNFLSPMMLAFDTPIPFNSIGRRNVSNVPAQALIMMNDPLVVQQAAVWAKRLAPGSGKTPEPLLREMYLSAYGRPASALEIERAVGFLQQQGTFYGLDRDKALADERVWADLCHVFFNVKEFIFIN